MVYLVTTQKQLFESYKDIEICDIDKSLAILWSLDFVAIDTETEGFDPHTCNLICLQLGNANNQFVVDLESISIQCYKELLENKELLLQNAKFDLRFLYKQKIFPKKVYDTFLAECILTTGIENRELGLKALAETYCGATLDKEIRGKIHYERLSSRVIKYAAEDVAYLHQIREKQLYRIKELQLEEVLNLENEAVKVFARMEFDGVLLDQKKWLGVADKTELEVVKLSKELDDIVEKEPKLAKFIPKYIQGDLFGEASRDLNINWSSNAQKLQILKTLKLNVDSVDERSLLKNKKEHIIVPKLLDYSKQAKLSTAFGRDFLKFINKNTGRIHADIWQLLATGRISVSKPNLNQIPSKGNLAKEIRSCFISAKGNVIVGGDYSGMELRIIAELSQDPLWLDAFNNNQDLHSVLCSKTFNIPITDVKKETPFKKGVTYRDVQKTVNFGLSYGMSKFKLADTIDISIDEADDLIKKFFKVVPEVNKFLNKIGDLGKQRGYIRTAPPFRRIRFFENWKSAVENDNFKILGEIERASKNTPIQGSNADVIKYALINVQKYIDKNKCPVKIILAVYDEIQTECDEEFAEEWKLILENIMKEAAKVIIKSIPVEVECKISSCWEK